MKPRAYLILRDRPAGITATLFTPNGARLGSPRVGYDECDARARVLTPTRQRLLQRLHPGAEIAVVGIDDPIPESLRARWRSFWGPVYRGGRDGSDGHLPEPANSEQHLGA